MIEGGFDYHVSDEQLERYRRLPLLARLEWLDQARLFALQAQTPATRLRQERLRRGEHIVPEIQGNPP